MMTPAHVEAVKERIYLSRELRRITAPKYKCIRHNKEGRINWIIKQLGISSILYPLNSCKR